MYAMYTYGMYTYGFLTFFDEFYLLSFRIGVPSILFLWETVLHMVSTQKMILGKNKIEGTPILKAKSSKM